MTEHIHVWKTYFDKDGNEVGQCECGAFRIFNPAPKAMVEHNLNKLILKSATWPVQGHLVLSKFGRGNNAFCSDMAHDDD